MKSQFSGAKVKAAGQDTVTGSIVDVVTVKYSWSRSLLNVCVYVSCAGVGGDGLRRGEGGHLADEWAVNQQD